MGQVDEVEGSTEEYAYWRGAMEGRFEELTVGKAESGFYRRRKRDGTCEPIAIWIDENSGHRLARVGNDADPIPADADFCERIFSWVAKDVISDETYWSVMEGNPWPDEPPAIGHNNPPPSLYGQFKTELEQENVEAEAWLAKIGGFPRTVEEKDRAANWANRVAALQQRADRQRDQEKRPFMEEARAIDEQWKPLVTAAEQLKRRLKAACGVWLDKENARLDRERREREAERRRIEEEHRAAAEAAAAKGEPIPEPPRVAIEDPNRPKRATAGNTGGTNVKAVKVRTAEIEDVEKALLFFKEHPKLRECLQTIANATARTGVTPAGCRIVETTSYR